MQKYTLVNISSISQSKILPQGIRIILEKPIFPQLDTSKPLKTLKIKEKRPEIFSEVSGKLVMPKNVKGRPFGVF